MKRLLLLLALFVSPPLWAANSPSPEEASQAVAAYRGERVMEVVYDGDVLPDGVRARVEALRGKEFSPTAVRSILLWYHENGGESFLGIDVAPVRGGVKLLVKSKQKLRIAEILFEGNSSFSSNVILPAIDLKDGFEFERDVAEGAVQKIVLFYSKQGYLATEVKYIFDEASRNLKFIISEGEPTLLDSFDISPLTTIELRTLRERYQRDIRERFALKVGERIQRDRVLDGIQAVKDWLREHDFLLARDPVLEYRVSTEGKVGLFLNINYGPRIRYGFRGNKQFSYRELLNFVSEVKEVASGSDYLVAVRRRVLEAYKEIGFANAQITSLVREDSARGIRYVSLIVNEGGKIEIENLNVEGVYSLSQADARKKLESLGTRLVQRGYFHESGINRAAELFAEYLKSLGFLSAKIEYVKFDFNEKRTKVNVSLLFSEGIQTKVQSIKISGVRSLQEQEVVEMLGLKENQPFDIFAFERGLIALKDRYQELGNLGAQIINEASENIVRYSKDNSQVSIHVEVEEGPIYQVGEVIVRGNKKTHARVVLRELPFTGGDVLTTPLLNEAEENLRKLNLFGEVIVRPIDRPGTENVKDILILIEETTPGSFDIVPGLRNDLGLRLGFELGYQNLGGWNRSVNASAVFNRRLENYKFPEYQFTVGFREPYLANWPVTFTSGLDVLRRQFSTFNATVSRLSMGVRRDLTRYLSGFLEYGYEQIKIRDVDLNKRPIEDQRTDFIGTLTPGFIVDSRNDRFNPSSGFNSVNRFEIASSYFGSKRDVAFYRTTSYNSAYFKILDDIVFAGGVNLGWERSNAVVEKNGKTEPSPIPAYKLFRLGGIGSLRGYREDAVEVETRRFISGVLGMVNYRGEFRIPLMGNLGSALFVDAGNLMVDRFTFAPEQLRSSAGAGLRYLTPVGPVVLDFAWRLQNNAKVGDTTTASGNDLNQNAADLDRFKIHFSIGAF
ncbi:MAG: POTRA domain-containing protein [Bacteriovoracia bacterium]